MAAQEVVREVGAGSAKPRSDRPDALGGVAPVPGGGHPNRKARSHPGWVIKRGYQGARVDGERQGERLKTKQAVAALRHML